MLWQKAWIETRWRFIIGLGILVCSGVGTVMLYAKVQGLAMAADPATLAPAGPIRERIEEQLQLARTLHGFIWANWFAQNMPQQWTLFAAILGTGGLVAQGRSGGALFTLSLPVSRERQLLTRVALSLVLLAALAMIPALAVALAAGGAFPIPEALFYGLSIFLGGVVIFALATWLSTLFTDVWSPALLAFLAAFLLALPGQLQGDPTAPNLYRIMSAASWFHDGRLPWLGWGASLVASALLIFAAAKSLARRDF